MTNSQFLGFPAKTDFIPLPSLFFTRMLPQIQDIAELKVTLYTFHLLHHKQGYPCFVTYKELLSHSALMAEMDEESLHHALSLAVERGSMLHTTLNIDGGWQDAYFINTESNRKAIESIKRGGILVRETMPEEQKPEHNIFVLYEQNIGIITPMVAEELKEAERLYPRQWIEAAFKEAVLMNKRNWKYVARILERWSSEGRDSGENRQGTKKSGSNKYIAGKYGHLVKR
jgi:DnaD/phage-associated family protein